MSDPLWLSQSKADVRYGASRWREPTILPTAVPVAAVGTWALAVDASSPYNCNRDNGGSGAQNDRIDYYVTLPAGTWSIVLTTDKKSNRGIITVSLDDGAGSFTSLGTADLYSASQLFGQQSTFTATVAGFGRKTLRIQVTSKNASSSSFVFALNAIDMARTA